MRRVTKFTKYWVYSASAGVLGLVVLLFAYLSYAKPAISLGLGVFSAWPGFLLLFLAILPAGKVRLGQFEKRVANWKWYGGIFLAQVLMGWVLLTQSLAFIGLGPDFAKNTLNATFAWRVTQDYWMNQWGIFPWGFYALWGVSLAFFTYNKKGVPFHHRHAAVFWEGPLAGYSKLMTEMVVIGGTILVLLLSIASSFILIYQGLRLYLHFPDYFETIFPDVVLFLIFFVVIFWSIGKKRLRKWSRRDISMATLLGISFVVVMTYFIAASFFGDWVKSNLPFPLPFQTCKCVENFEKAGPDIRFALFQWSWWLLFAPLMGSWIARISVGRTIREVVLVMMVVPLCFYLYLLSGAPFVLPDLHHPWIYLLIGGVTFTICLILLRGRRNSELLAAGFMPVPETTPMGVTSLKQGTKIHGLSHFGQRIILGPLGVVLLHITGGWLLIQYPVVILGPFILIKTCFCMLGALFYQLFKDGAMRYTLRS
ncbi:MAG: BCCT family transporter [Gammaproteobacteria bacterium]